MGGRRQPRRTRTSTSSPSRRTSTSSWPRIRHQAGRSWALAGSVDSTRSTVPGRTSAGRPRRLDHRHRAACAARVHEHLVRVARRPPSSVRWHGHSPVVPSRSRTRASAAGRATQEPLGLVGEVGGGGGGGQADPDVAVGERAHRRQHVRRLERAGRARRPRADGEPGGVELAEQGLAVGQQAGEGQDVGEPVVGVAHHLDVGATAGTLAQQGDDLAAAASAPRGGRPAGRRPRPAPAAPGAPGARAVARRRGSSGQGERHRPGAHHQHPVPGGRPTAGRR